MTLALWLSSLPAQAQAPQWAWANDIHGTASEWARDVAVDTLTGDVVVVGEFSGDLSAGFGAVFAGLNGGGFVAKFDLSGNLLWAFPIGNNQDDACNGVVVSPSGNIYVTGYLQNTADFKGTLASPSTILTSAGGKDVFLAKYNSSGQLQWARRAGGPNDDEGYAVCTNTSGIFITGYFIGSGSFGGIPTVSNKTNENVFAAAYDANGNIQWLTDGGSNLNTFGRDIIADNNNVYIIGDFKGSPLEIYSYTGANVANVANATPSSEDAYVLSLQTGGPFNWIRVIHSSSRDFGRGIAQNSAGLYITGSISSSATFPSYAGNPANTTAVGLDMYVASLNKAAGATNWVVSEQGASDEEAMSICVDTANLLALTGYYQSSLTFSTGVTLNSAGNDDIFVAAYTPAGTYQWATEAGASGDDIPYGISASQTGELYIAGEYANNAQFGSLVLTPDSPKNIFVAKLGCAPISANTISAAQTICAGQTPAALTGSTPGGGSAPYTYLWQSSPNNTTWASATGVNNAQNYAPPALASSTYYRRVVTCQSGCPGSDTSASILINVDQPPSVALAGNDSSLCATSISLYADSASSGTGVWTLVAGTATIVSAGSPTSAVTGMGAGQNIFAWTLSNGVCTASSDTVVITVNAMPTAANAGSDQSICSPTFTLSANTPLVGTGQWTVLGGGGTVATATLSASAVSGLSAGANSFVWTISNGVCPSSSDTVVLMRDLAPTISNAGADQSICATSFTLNANVPSVGTGSWNVISGGATLANPMLNNTNVTGLTNGVNAFEWVISNGSCAPSRDTLYLLVSVPPSPANAGADQIICASSFTLNATVPAIGSGNWTVLSGGSTVASPSSATSIVNNLSTGNNIFLWTVTNGACAPTSDSVSIQVDSMPGPANAGNNQNICSDSILLNASLPSVGTGSWTLVSGSGTISNPTQNSTLVYGMTSGGNVFMWSVTNGVCPPSAASVTITVDARPSTAVAGADQTICSGTVTLAGNLPIAGTGVWNVLAGGSAVTNPASNTSAVTGLSSGANVFEWVISNGSCPSSRDTVVIFVDAPPSAANAGAAQNLCVSTATLNATAPAIGNGTWTMLTGGATVTATAQINSTVTGLSVGVNSFEWVVSNGSCAPARDTVFITVDPMPTPANAGPDQTLCGSSGSMAGTAPTIGNGMWTTFGGTGFVAFPGAPNSGVSGMSAGANIFVWTVTNGVCPSSSDTVVINVVQPGAAANAGADQNICINSPATVLSAVAPGVGAGSWSVIAGTGTVSNPAQNNSAVTGLSPGPNIFVWSVNGGICGTTSDTVSILVFPNPTAATAGPDITVNGSTVTLNANIPANGTGAWTLVSGSGSITMPASASTIVNGLSIGDNVFAWTISNGVCPDSYDEVVVHVNDLVIPNGFSPNADLINDTFEVLGLELFSNAELEVFNRWGNLVYENKQYKNDWGGKNLAGEDLTDDTYYFKLKISAAKTYTGFVVLKRK